MRRESVVDIEAIDTVLLTFLYVPQALVQWKYTVDFNFSFLGV